MAIYRFDKSSLLDEVVIQHTPGGGARGYLHAKEGASADALDVLKKSLTAHGIQATPIQQGDKPVLEVRGFGQAEVNLIRLLDRSGAISGAHTKQSTPDDKILLRDKLKKNTLTLSGLSYFVGDVNYLSYGIREAVDSGKPQSVWAGIFYALGTPFLTFFGRGDKSDLQLKHMSYNLIKDMEKQGIEVPQDSAARSVADGHNTTTMKKIHSFLERYPAELANSMFAFAGSMIVWEKAREVQKWDWHPIKDFKSKDGGLKKVSEFLKHKEFVEGETPHAKWSVLMDIGLGLMTITAGLVSVLIEEEKPKENEPKKTGLGGLWQKIKARPLAVAGGSLLAATSAHAASTWVDWKHAKSINKSTLSPEGLAKIERLEGSLIRRGVFVGANVLAEIIMGLSSKGHGSGVRSDVSIDQSAYAVGADLVQRAAPEKREELLDKVSQFYAHKKHLSGDPAVIKEGIRGQLATIAQNPWTGIPAPKERKEDIAPHEDHYWRGRATTSQSAGAPSPAI